MNDTTIKTPEAAAAADAPKEKKLANIVRGVMPVYLVYMIKFEETGTEKDADVAKVYGTTSGKVSDVRKGRNFGYLTKDFAPTAEQKAAAIEWMKKVPGYGEPQDKIVIRIEKTPDATPEQAAAFLAGRAGSRAKTPKAEGTPSSETSAGDGKPAKAKGKSAPATAETGKDLMK